MIWKVEALLDYRKGGNWRVRTGACSSPLFYSLAGLLPTRSFWFCSTCPPIFCPELGLSYSMANHLRLPLAKPGRRGILHIQKANSTYSFPNLVTKVYGFATTECIHSTILLLALKSCTKLLHLLSYFSSARLEYCIWIHIQLVIQNPKVIYFSFTLLQLHILKWHCFTLTGLALALAFNLGLHFVSTRHPWYPHS